MLVPSGAVGGSPPSSAAPRTPALVVITADGLAPRELRVSPAAPIFWLNRTPQSAIAISFDGALPEPLEDCAERRAFHAVPGYGPFTMLLPPGGVAALCAPSEAGRYAYLVHGEVTFTGTVDVTSDDDGAEIPAP